MNPFLVKVNFVLFGGIIDILDVIGCKPGDKCSDQMLQCGDQTNVTKLSQNTPLHSKLSCNGALFCVFSKKHLTNMQFRAAILLSTLSKMALVVRSVSRHKNYKEDYL